jgi:hypothetical protein
MSFTLHFLLAIAPLLSALAEPDSNGYDPETRQTAANAVNIASWETQDLPNFRIRLNLPPGYKQKHWAVVFGSRDVTTFQRGHQNEIDCTIENVGEANPENAKVIIQKDYVDYKEWSQLIGGHKVLSRHFRAVAWSLMRAESACRTKLRLHVQSMRNTYCGLVRCWEIANSKRRFSQC